MSLRGALAATKQSPHHEEIASGGRAHRTGARRKCRPRNDTLKRDLADLLEVDIEQLIRFPLRVSLRLVLIPRADSTLTV